MHHIIHFVGLTSLKKAQKSFFHLLFLFISLIFGLFFTSFSANAATCIQFHGTDNCINAKLTVTNESYANAWGEFGPPVLYPSEAAAIAALNQGAQTTGTYAGGWSTNTPLPAASTIDQVPVGSIWSELDDYGNPSTQEKGIQAFVNGTNVGHWVIYKLDYNTYPCPIGSTLIGDGMSAQGYPYPMCHFIKPVAKQCPSTPYPCSITSGNKFKPQEDWRATIGPLSFKRNYNSLDSAYNSILGVSANAAPFGTVWTHNYNLQLLFFANQGSTVKNVSLMRPNGLNVFASNNYTDTTIAGTGGWFINRDAGLKLNQLADGTWQVINIKTNDIESYDANGRLTKITYRNGQFVTLTYPTTVVATSTTPAVVYYNPTQVTDNFGQSLIFTYNTTGYLTSVTLPTGKSITYTYDVQNRLSTVSRPGYGIKTYLYSETSTIAPSGNPNLLTGIIDEKGTRFESYAYDSSDRGISTSMAGGVENYTLNYSANGYNAVTDPHGLTKNYYVITASGSPVVGTTVLMQGGSATVQEHNYTYDAAGNIASDTHFGVTTNYSYDLTRNLETSRTEAVGTPQQRTITTQWDPNLPVPVLITEQGRTTAYTYDANGNVLTKTITDTTATPNVSRVWTYTYNSVGQKLTETNPAGQSTTYVYDNNGSLHSVIDNLGRTTTYSNYNALGQPQLINFANGHQIQYTYDDAGRVTQTSESVSSDPYQTIDGNNTIQWPQWIIDLINALYQLFGQSSPFDNNGATPAVVSQPLTANTVRTDITLYTYDPIGQLTQVQMPSGETLTYSYDDAHRLVGATDSVGNSITYTLNGAGDITKTVSQDPTGNIKVQTQQVFDNLGRVSQDIGNNNQSSTYTYDNLNNLTNTTDALTRNSSSTYDALDRKVTDVDALNDTSTYSYNALDQLLAVTDARNNKTTYTPNAFGENIQENSPDTGLTTRSYNNGQLTSVVDANGTSHSYTYDKLSRVTQRTDGTGTGQLVTQYGYDAGTNDIGYLTSVSNANSTIHYSHDTLGNVVEKEIALKTSAPLRVQYKYLAGNKISDIMMPSGHHITYNYTAGRVTGISTDIGTLLSNILYSPAGVASWNWGDSNTSTDTNTFSYDLDGRMTHISSTGVLDHTYTFDAGNRILNIADTTAGIGTQSYTHDKLDRLVQQVLASQTLAYGYDANSNRTYKVSSSTSQSQTVPYCAFDANAYANYYPDLKNAFGYDSSQLQNHWLTHGIYENRTPCGQKMSTCSFNAQTYVNLWPDLVKAQVNGLQHYINYGVYEGRGICPLSGVETIYTLQSSSNRINSMTVNAAGATTSLSTMYLSTGQLVTDGVKNYAYDSAGRSISIRNGSNLVVNTYDGLGQRISKNGGTSTIYFMYDEHGHLLGEYNPDGSMIREYIWLGDRVVGMYSKDVANTLLRVHTDHLGTPRAVTQGDGTTRQVLWRFEGDAFGDVLPTNPTATVFTMPLRMAGQYFDAEVGISYNYFRDYDPSTSRYVESDPIGLKAGMNTYGYVGGSPVRGIDPKGLVEWSGSVLSMSASPFERSSPVGVGGGRIFEIYTLYAKCKNGDTAYARVHTTGWAVGFGLPIAMSGGSVSLEDGQDDANPDILNGAYKEFNYGYGWGIGLGGGLLQLGGARTLNDALSPSLFGGVNIGITGAAGTSTVVDKKKCGCS